MISSRKLLSKINSFKEGIEPTILGIVTCGLEIISINFIFCRIGEDPKTSKVGLISSGEILKLVTKSINLSRDKEDDGLMRIGSRDVALELLEEIGR